MEVEFTARQGKISTALRMLAEEEMERVRRILGKAARASITFSAQRHVQIVELTIQARLHTIAATGKADTADAALRQAIDHAENQARRFRDRRLESKRLPKGEKMLTAPPVARPKARPPSRRRRPRRGSPPAARFARRSPCIRFPPARRWLSRILSERRCDRHEAHDHRRGRERRRVPRPRPADLSHVTRRTVCAPPSPRRPDGVGGNFLELFPQLHSRAQSAFTDGPDAGRGSWSPTLAVKCQTAGPSTRSLRRPCTG